jgi:hypothetical protein
MDETAGVVGVNVSAESQTKCQLATRDWARASGSESPIQRRSSL